MKIKLTLDKKTKTILFWRRSQGSSPIRSLNETEDVVYRGEVPPNFRHGNCNDFYLDKKVSQIKAWHEQNEEAERCTLLKAQCKSLFFLHRRITNARSKAKDKIGYSDVFCRTVEDAKKFLADNATDAENYPFLQHAIDIGNGDAKSVAQQYVLKATEYDTLLLQTEKLRHKWSKGVSKATTPGDVSKVTQTLMASTLLD